MKFNSLSQVNKFLAAAIILSALLPIVAFAVGLTGPIVPCGTGENAKLCHFSDLVTLANNIITFLLFNLLVPIAILAFIYGGFLMITAQSDPGQLKQGKDVFFGTVVGFVIAFGAWLIIQMVISTLVTEGTTLTGLKKYIGF